MRIAKCLEDRQIDAVRAVGHGALPTARSPCRRAVPREREEQIGRAVATDEVLVVGEVQRLAGRDVDDLHLQIRDLMIEVEQDEGHIVGAHGEQRATGLRHKGANDFTIRRHK